ncbi:hypothetical protein AWB77_02648 [Caballeronia fortuita]|uniref:Uncharacterized protein n=2 Tax=Caballeronia fortuita TaxID=1777138 RepID=A0A158BCF9_9BURK|nr:hypothetical protein AWB77_02648 [Caballeronia fortuita]
MSINLLVVFFLFAAAIMLCFALAEYVVVWRIVREDRLEPHGVTRTLPRSDWFFFFSSFLCFASLLCLMFLE